MQVRIKQVASYMYKLVTGHKAFKTTDYHQNRNLFQELANGQAPEALFITCSDSRIDPNMLTGALPGELFICRNAGNIVPPHTAEHTGGITASIEFAVMVLNVEHIIICGHTDCGAMKGALDPDSIRSLPHVFAWLSHCHEAVEKAGIEKHNDSPEALLEMTRSNIRQQLEHLQEHPSVARNLKTGMLELHGWLYDIGHGNVTCLDDLTGEFVSIDQRYASLLEKEQQE